jgi:SAM-dependent methyltransferase
MCNEACIIFVAKSLTREDVAGKQVIELGVGPIGAKPLLTAWSPKQYVGLNVCPGPGVDVVMSAEVAADSLGPERFDVVLCTEMLEHVRDWRAVVNSLKRLCKPGGRLIITTRSLGYGFHGPPDYWRYEPSDFERIFSDFPNRSIEIDPLEPGVFLAATRPASPLPLVDLAPLELYSMVYHRRTSSIPPGPLPGFVTAWTLLMALALRGTRKLMEGLRELSPFVRFAPSPPPTTRTSLSKDERIDGYKPPPGSS